MGHNHKNNVQDNYLIMMLLDLNHFGVTHNLHWKLQSLHILYMNIANANWQISLSLDLLLIAKWIPNVKVFLISLCFVSVDLNDTMKKQAKLLVPNKEAEQGSS